MGSREAVVVPTEQSGRGYGKPGGCRGTHGTEHARVWEAGRVSWYPRNRTCEGMEARKGVVVPTEQSRRGYEKPVVGRGTHET